MTKPQRRLVGVATQAELAILLRVRQWEHNHHGAGIPVAQLLTRKSAWYVDAVSGLIYTGHLSPSVDGIITTAGPARQINKGWWQQRELART